MRGETDGITVLVADVAAFSYKPNRRHGDLDDLAIGELAAVEDGHYAFRAGRSRWHPVDREYSRRGLPGEAEFLSDFPAARGVRRFVTSIVPPGISQ
jgi:hypothetical protein